MSMSDPLLFSFPFTKILAKLRANTGLLVYLFCFSVTSDSVYHVVCLRNTKGKYFSEGEAALICFPFSFIILEIGLLCGLPCKTEPAYLGLVNVKVHRMALNVKIKERTFLLELAPPSGLPISVC